MDAFTITCIVIGVLLVVGIVILAFVKPSQDIDNEIETENKMYEEENHQKNADQIKDNVKKASLAFSTGLLKVLFTVVYIFACCVVKTLVSRLLLSGYEVIDMEYIFTDSTVLIITAVIGYKLYKYLVKKIFK